MKLRSMWFACLVALLGAAPASAAGYQHVVAPDPQGKPLEVGIWYPSNAPTSPQALELYTQTVAPDGAIAGSGLPLIVISHGTGGSFAGHYDTALALADAGFVVAAVTHTGDNWRDQSAATHIMDRPRQIERVIDYMLSGWSDAAHIDPARIGIFGFSAGGFTALVDIGGEPDLPLIGPHCNDHPHEYVCALLAAHADPATSAPVIAIERERDPRIKAAVIAAPALGFTFAPDGLKGVTVPVQLWRAGDDAVLPSPFYAEPVYDALPERPEYTVVPHAGHFDFLAPCTPALAAQAPAICTSEPAFDRAAFHADFNRSVVAFFEKTLAAK